MEHFTRNAKIRSKTQYLQEMSKALFTYLLLVSWYELILFDTPVLQSYCVISRLSFLSFLSFFVVLCS